MQSYPISVPAGYLQNRLKPFSDVFGVTSRRVLSDYASLDELAAIPVQDLAQTLHEMSGHHLPNPFDNARKLQQVAQEMGARYVLEGSVQKSGDRVRINAQLIDAQTGHHLWAESYDRVLEDIFAIQDDITLKLMETLQVKLIEEA